MSFNKLKLIDPVIKAIEERGYKDATYIQKKTIPLILQRKNFLGIAKKGTGKTAAYAIPVVQLIHRIDKNNTDKPIIRGLVITSSDKLSLQVGKTFSDYAKHTIVKHAVITDPDNQDQLALLSEGVNVLIGTAKNISAIFNKQPKALAEVKMLVLDEFDVTVKEEGSDAVKNLLGSIPTGIVTFCFVGEGSEEVETLLEGRLENAEKFVVKGKPKKNKKKGGPSSDKSKNKDGNRDGGKDKNKQKKKKKKKGGGGRRSTEMSDKLKSKFMWPLEK